MAKRSLTQRISGITIEIGGDTTKLTESLKKVDSSLKTTQTNLKDVNKLLKLDPNNTELLRQKQELLGKAVADSKTRLEELKRSLAQLEASPNADKTIDQQNALKREIIETENALKSYQKELSNSSIILTQVGNVSKDVAEKTKGISTAAAALGTALIGNAVNSAKAVDDLITLSAQYGVTTEQIQKMNYAQDLIDVSTSDMLASMNKLTKQMGSGSKTFEKLGISIYDTNGEMRDSTEVWYEALEALSQITNETERDVYAQELFGKSAQSLTGIIDDGGQALKQYGDEAEELGLILTNDGINAAGKFNDGMDKIKARGQQALLKVGAALTETLLPALEDLVDWITEVVQWFAEMDGSTQTVILGVIAAVAAISPLAALISSLTTIVGGLSAAMTFLCSPIGLVVAAVAAAIAIGVALYKNWDTIKEKAKSLWDSVKSTFEGLKNSVSDKFTAIKDTITEKIDGAKEAVRNAIEKIKGFFNFKWELPKLKMPHISVSGGFSLIPPSAPKFSVEWYRKAMDQGMILNSPTIFGYQNGRFLGAGEAGSETVVGTNSLMRMIQQASGSGVVINMTVNGAQGQNVTQLAQEVSNVLQRELKSRGTVWQ